MKKLPLFLFVALLIQTTKAQTWCPPGAQWHYRVSVPFHYHFQDGYIQLNYAGTLTLGGQNCTQLSGTYYGVRAWVGTFGGTVIPNYVNVATYESNKVIYAYNQSTSSFDTLVNFNATIGDVWLGYREGSGCEFPPPLVSVLDTSHVIINGQTLKTVSVSITYSTSGSVSSLIIEKIGPIHEFMIPHENCHMHGLYYGDFVCYSDPNFQLYKKPGYVFPCDFNTVGNEESNTKDSRFNIFPNPVEDKLRLEYYQEGRDMSYVLVDVFGKVQLNKKLNGPESLDLKDLKEGVYFLLLYDQTKLLSTKKIVKN